MSVRNIEIDYHNVRKKLKKGSHPFAFHFHHRATSRRQNQIVKRKKNINYLIFFLYDKNQIIISFISYLLYKYWITLSFCRLR